MQEIGLILTLMDKAIRQLALYGETHPQARGAIDAFVGKLGEYLSSNDRLELLVKRTQFEWEGNPVFTLEKEENNYIQEMYLDGLRQLEVLPQVTAEELRGLIGVFSRDVREYESQEDDTVTLLWKKGFQNIRYQTIDIYAGDLNSMLREQVADEDLTESEREEHNFLDQFIDQLVQGRPLHGVKTSATVTAGPMAADIARAIPIDRFRATEETTEFLSKEVEDSIKRNHLEESVIIFCEVMEEEVDEKAVETLLTAYLGVALSQLQEGHLRVASDWLKRLRGVQVYVSQKNPDTHPLFEAAFANFLSRAAIKDLGEKMAEGMKAAPEDWSNFFRYVGDGSAEIVCELLPYVHQETLQSSLVDFLVNDAPDKIEVYHRCLKRPEWTVVRNMIRILGRLLDEEGVQSALKPLAAHPRPQVRQEVVRVIGQFTGPITHEIFRRAIGDADEMVRGIAVRLITQTADSFFARPLAEEITRNEFVERDPLEKRRTMIALARCGGVSTIEFLEQIVRDAGSGELKHEMRLAALYGLAEVEDLRANQLLDEFASKMLLSKGVRETAKKLQLRKATPSDDSADG